MICEFHSEVRVFFSTFCHIKLNYKSALVLHIATHSQQANYGEGFCACRILVRCVLIIHLFSTSWMKKLVYCFYWMRLIFALVSLILTKSMSSEIVLPLILSFHLLLSIVMISSLTWYCLFVVSGYLLLHNCL